MHPPPSADEKLDAYYRMHPPLQAVSTLRISRPTYYEDNIIP